MSERLEFVLLANQEKANLRQLCRRFGISPRTAYKWLARFKKNGVAGLADRSRRPHHSPAQTPVGMEKKVLSVHRKYPDWGGRKLQQRLLDLGHQSLPSPNTFTAILRRHHLLDPRESAKHRAFQRFERAVPNELWQMDFKGEFQLPRGGRCYPLTILDDHSRFALGLQACTANTTPITQAAVIEVFRRYGLPEAITCDNGPPLLVTTPALVSGCCDWGFSSFTRGLITRRPRAKMNAFIELLNSNFYATCKRMVTSNVNKSSINGATSTTTKGRTRPWA